MKFVVVAGGVAGLPASLAAARAGHDAVVLERDPVHADGSPFAAFDVERRASPTTMRCMTGSRPSWAGARRVHRRRRPSYDQSKCCFADGGACAARNSGRRRSDGERRLHGGRLG
jgi:thioredoxin reductase